MMILHLTLLIFFGELKVDAEPLFFKGLQNIWDASQVLIYKKGLWHVDTQPDTYKLPDCFGFLLRPRNKYKNMIFNSEVI